MRADAPPVEYHDRNDTTIGDRAGRASSRPTDRSAGVLIAGPETGTAIIEGNNLRLMPSPDDDMSLELIFQKMTS